MGPMPPSTRVRMASNLRTPQARAMRFSDFSKRPSRSRGSTSATSSIVLASTSWRSWLSALSSGRGSLSSPRGGHVAP
eukprot:5845673-Pyramimonas_sp.AAC.1